MGLLTRYCPSEFGVEHEPRNAMHDRFGHARDLIGDANLLER